MARPVVTPALFKPLVIIAGGYGSGKSEVSVNLARLFASEHGCRVTLADLDLVNPYFRSREAAAELERHGIRCIVPPGNQSQADLPILLPEVKGAAEEADEAHRVILDVGGDDDGSRVLSSIADAFLPGAYDLLLVLNKSRPFTSDPDGALAVMRRIEEASRLRFTGIIANSHLLEHTEPQMVLDGLALARAVGRAAGLPVVCVAGTRDILEALPADSVDVPVLPLERELLKPWERHASPGTKG